MALLSLTAMLSDSTDGHKLTLVFHNCHLPLPLSGFLNFFPQRSFSPGPLSLSYSLASMQEWEVLLGDRLAPFFQEAETLILWV